MGVAEIQIIRLVYSNLVTSIGQDLKPPVLSKPNTEFGNLSGFLHHIIGVSRASFAVQQISDRLISSDVLTVGARKDSKPITFVEGFEIAAKFGASGNVLRYTGGPYVPIQYQVNHQRQSPAFRGGGAIGFADREAF